MFNYSICEPLNPTITEHKNVSVSEFREVMENFPWTALLKEQTSAKEEDVHYSPSLELQHTQTNHGLAVSIVGDANHAEFYIFFKRPKTITKRKLFRTVTIDEPEYISDRTGQTAADVKDAFNALLEGNYDYLEQRWG